LEGEFEAVEVDSIFTAPQTTFGVTLHLMVHKNRGTREWALPRGLKPAGVVGLDVDLADRRSARPAPTANLTGRTCATTGS
jgi:hypothetical protein